MYRILEILVIVFFITSLSYQPVSGQQLDCNFKPPVFKIDFGNTSVPTNLNIGYLSNYNKVNDYCPVDGNYSFVSFTTGCFNGDWITVAEDHTEGDREGMMMIVNASDKPGIFFQYAAGGLAPGAVYEFSAWIVNICKTLSPCDPTPPSLSFIIQNIAGTQIAIFNTGVISPSDGANWHRYYGQFTSPPGTKGVILKMNDDTNGGCGNDFAIDDIMLKECVLQKPKIIKLTNPAPAKPPVVTKTKTTRKAPKPPVKKADPPIKKNIPTLSKEQVKLKADPVKTIIKDIPVNVPVPKVLLTRSNPVIKKDRDGPNGNADRTV